MWLCRYKPEVKNRNERILGLITFSCVTPISHYNPNGMAMVWVVSMSRSTWHLFEKKIGLITLDWTDPGTQDTNNI